MVANLTVCLSAPGPGVSEITFAVRDRRHVFVGNDRDIEGRLVGGFVKRRKRAPRVGRFKLRHRVLARLLVLSQVQTAQFVVQDANVLDVNGRWPRLNRLLPNDQRRHFFFFVERDFRLLRRTAAR